ncbi:hypothetical protein PSMK_02510 [Phycisphaera mikurensis NBRC 102666]|uniref:Uncharacterized protein n=2 Tax=Phycisphaera TaxID=666508 RepID=I0IAX2_PHYMF|nr:hypothetical protein PSMK_02510 [Phycisphaera mikurensis NBRC 102666]
MPLGGCVGVEAVAGIFGGGGAGDVRVVQRSHDLDGRSLAVVAAVDPETKRRHPGLGPALEALLALRFARHVEGAAVVPPEEVTGWQREHAYWETAPPGRVAEGLGVDRVVRVEVSEFRTRQEGNAWVLEGVLNAAVQVYEAEGTAGAAGLGDPDRPVFLERVTVRFPEDSPVGLATLGDSGDPGPGGAATQSGPDEAAVKKNLLAAWLRRVGPIFYDQKEAQKRDRRRERERADAGPPSRSAEGAA